MEKNPSATEQLFDHLTPPTTEARWQALGISLEHYEIEPYTVREFANEISDHVDSCRFAGLGGRFRFGMLKSGSMLGMYSQHGCHGLGFWEEVTIIGLIYGEDRAKARWGGSRIDGLWVDPREDEATNYAQLLIKRFLAEHAMPCNAVTARTDIHRAHWYEAAGFERIFDEDESITRWAHG